MNKLHSALINFIVLLTMIVSTNSPASATPMNPYAVDPLHLTAPLYRQDSVLVGFYAEALGVQANTQAAAKQLLEQNFIGQQALERQFNLESLHPLFNTRIPQQAGALKMMSAAQRQLAIPDQPVAIFQMALLPGTDVESILATLHANPAVAFAEPDYLALPALTPNDPHFDSNEQWGLAKIQAPQAWNLETGSNETIIAVIDSGIQTNHEDLVNQLWTNPNEIPANGLDDDHNGYIDDVHGANMITQNGSLTDSTGHGTQVAGVIAAQTNNALGVAGVCWNCRLMVVKVIGATGTANYSDIAAGVNYAVKMGAKVINLSLGGYSDSFTLKAAIQAAAQTAVVVAGAGNDNLSTPFYPAAYIDSVIAVAGTAQDDFKHSSSNFGSWVTVSAPGENILTTDFGGNYYTPNSGTSLAAPFVSGVSGLLVSQNPGWSPALVRQQIVHTTNSIDSLNPSLAGNLGSGRLNAYQAVSTAPVPNFSIQGFTVAGKLNGTIKADGSPIPLWLTFKK